MLRQLLTNQDNWNKTAIIDGELIHTYKSLVQKAAALQKGLTAPVQTKIAILLPNSADYISALYGVWMAGMMAFPLSVQLTPHEIAALLTQAAASTIVTSTAYRQLFEEGDLASAALTVVYMEDCPPSSIPPQVRELPPHAPILLLTTSGTTGNAKIVQLSEENMEAAIEGFIAYNDYPRFSDVEIRYILCTPFSSIYGLLILPVCIIHAFPVIISKGAFTLDTLYRAADEHGVTHYEGGTAIPILMEQMLGKAIPYDISTLRFVGFGGSKVSADVLRRLEEAFPDIEFCPGYGMTESSALIARPYKRVKSHKRDSIGTPIPHVTVCFDVDGTITDTPNTMGELVVKGPNVMLGYYNNREETEKIIQKGWLHTGDIGYMDEEGDIFLCGRKKNVIMVRGFSVYAEEVEASLLSSGLVKDCIVYGKTDSDGSELLCADIVPLSDPINREALHLWCRAHLAEYKQPRLIRFTDALSKTATGKNERPGKNDHEAD